MQNPIRMRNVSRKEKSLRGATAQAVISGNRATFQQIQQGTLDKGDVLAAAVLAGVSGAKQTATLIPLCHPVQIDHVDIRFILAEDHLIVISQVTGVDRTGMEMEALTGATLAALTIYDMAKPIDPSMKISDILLLEKTGGKSGNWKREQD